MVDLFRSIVVPTDFSPLAEAAAVRAATFARLNGASVHFVHAPSYRLIINPQEFTVPEAVWEGFRRAALEKLEVARKEAERRGVQVTTAELADSSSVVQAISAAVEAHSADLIVMGTHGHNGFKLAYLGSAAERTLRTVDCPVLAVKEDAAKLEEPISRILLAVDFSAHSDRAIEMAIELGTLLKASLHVIHVYDRAPDHIPYASFFGMEFDQKVQESASDRLESIRERFKESPVPVAVHFRRGSPSVLISEAAEEMGCQLIIMGTRGNSGLSHVLLGSVAERTLRTAPCSVLTVKAKDCQGDE
jgi:nucleotide-binding universal stress UspA family protein